MLLERAGGYPFWISEQSGDRVEELGRRYYPKANVSQFLFEVNMRHDTVSDHKLGSIRIEKRTSHSLGS